jgi:FdhE protein
VTDQAAAQLDEIARTDPTAAPLARLHLELLRASADRAWEQAVPALDAARLSEGLPLLHGEALRVDRDRLRRLAERLASTAEQGGAASARAARQALAASQVDPLALLAAAVRQDVDALAETAGDGDLDLDLLATLGQLLAVPLLRACGARADALLAGSGWEAGYCPVCAAWPTLAELRGLERLHWLRCGRCGVGWRYSHLRCAYCGSRDHRAQGYLAAEAEREARRAVTCDACHGYLKTLATLGALAPAELPVQDLLTLELDVAALERGYGRPTTPGFPLAVTVEAAPRGSRWLAWTR